MKKEIKAPFIPIITGEKAVGNFAKEFTELPIESYDPNSMSI